jgi:quaternary ammonium compound-resistance protein SugE
VGWVYLLLAGLFEVGFTTAMRYTQAVRLDWPNIAFAVCVVLSFGFLQEAQKTIPLGTAYAVWVGIGAVGTIVVGVMLGEETLGLARALLLMGLVGCVVGLKLIH